MQEAIPRDDVPSGYPFDPDDPVPEARPSFQSDDWDQISRGLRKSEILNPSKIPLSDEDVDFVIAHARESLVVLDAAMNEYARHVGDWTSAVIHSESFLGGRFETEREAKEFARKACPLARDGHTFARMVRTFDCRPVGGPRHWRVAMVDPFTHLHIYQSWAEVVRRNLEMRDAMREGMKILEQRR